MRGRSLLTHPSSNHKHQSHAPLGNRHRLSYKSRSAPIDPQTRLQPFVVRLHELDFFQNTTFDHRHNAESRDRQHKIHSQQAKVQRLAAAPMVVSDLLQAMPRREWLQTTHPFRIARASYAARRRRPAQTHRGLLAAISARLSAVTADESWREESEHEPVLSGVYSR